MAIGAMGVSGAVAVRRAAGFRARQRKAALRMVQQRARAAQVATWIEKFGSPGRGRLEREELSHLLQHLKPEMGEPHAHVLDQLLIHATEVKTYSLHIRGDPHGTVRAELIMLTVSAYSMYCAVAGAFDRRAGESGLVALRDLPALLREANNGMPCDTRDFDYVMDCCAALLPMGLPLEPTTTLSRENVLSPFLANDIKFGKRVSVHALLDENASDETGSTKSDDMVSADDMINAEVDEEDLLWEGARVHCGGGGGKGGGMRTAMCHRTLSASTQPRPLCSDGSVLFRLCTPPPSSASLRPPSRPSWLAHPLCPPPPPIRTDIDVHISRFRLRQGRALRIQTALRRFTAVRFLARCRLAAIKVQSAARRKFAWQKMRKRRKAAAIIGRMAKGVKPRRQAQLRRKAATVIGRVARGRVTRLMILRMRSMVVAAPSLPRMGSMASFGSLKAIGSVKALGSLKSFRERRSSTVGSFFGTQHTITAPATGSFTATTKSASQFHQRPMSRANTVPVRGERRQDRSRACIIS